jgi:hypothetical protein
MLEWLSTDDYGARQSDLIDRRQEGTGLWFLAHPKFTSWVEGSTRTLLCPGIPGAGKTFMTAIVVNFLRAKHMGGNNIGISVLYCSYPLRQEQTKEKLMASLLRQLLTHEQSKSEEMVTLNRQCLAEGRRPSFSELSSLLEHVLEAKSKVFILIDALDECSSSEWPALTAEMQRLQALVPSVRLLLTYRPQIIFEGDFLDSDELHIRASDHDMERYIRNHISQLSKHVRDQPGLKETVVQSIIQAADGM